MSLPQHLLRWQHQPLHPPAPAMHSAAPVAAKTQRQRLPPRAVQANESPKSSKTYGNGAKSMMNILPCLFRIVIKSPQLLDFWTSRVGERLFY